MRFFHQYVPITSTSMIVVSWWAFRFTTIWLMAFVTLDSTSLLPYMRTAHRHHCLLRCSYNIQIHLLINNSESCNMMFSSSCNPASLLQVFFAFCTSFCQWKIYTKCFCSLIFDRETQCSRPLSLKTIISLQIYYLQWHHVSSSALYALHGRSYDIVFYP